MENINQSQNPHLKIQAFAGTGKSLVLALLVEVALTKNCTSNSAVVIVTPSRNLRDSILQGPDFYGHVFTEADLGPRVVWLGRPSDSPGSLGSWEDKIAELINQRLVKERQDLRDFEKGVLWANFEVIKHSSIDWAELPSGEVNVIPDSDFHALEDFRQNALEHMKQIFQMKMRRAEEMEKILDESRQGHLIVSTMDAFVKWRAGEIKGFINRYLKRLHIKLFCMEEFESFDVPQVVAALSNVDVKTMLMVGDINQRVESCRHRGKRVNFSGDGTFTALTIARDGIAEDQEQYDYRSVPAAQSSTVASKGAVAVPEARPWHEWCSDAENGVLDLCKRCGPKVCNYIQRCFRFAATFASDKTVAYDTRLEHVFFDGDGWRCSPLRQGSEVGWHQRLFESICHAVVADLQKYQKRHSGIQRLPTPTVVVIMPLSRSAIPLCVLIQKEMAKHGIPEGVVTVSLPLNTRGESVPIVHCVRHRRFVRVADQYAGTQQNLNQEYINLTRGVEKTCMWLETQPFGHPYSPYDARYSSADGGSGEDHCAAYASRRNRHIWDENLEWGLLQERGNIVKAYSECFGENIESEAAKRLYLLSKDIWNKLKRREIRDLPRLGKGFSDFKSLDDVLSQAAGRSTALSKFAFENTRKLRNIGHGSAAERWNVNETHEKALRPVDPLDWKPAMRFSHLLLPCMTAESSSQPLKGLTRLCLPFIRASDAMNPEEAIASLCSLTWFLAFLLDKNLVEYARLRRVSHKMHITEDDGDLWFNKSCQSGRIATAIKDRDSSVVYMYIGGGAVDYDQSYLLGGLVVSCKGWRWAALVYVATRVVGLASNNSLGPLNPALMVSMDAEDGDLTAPACEGFREFCEGMWEQTRMCCKGMLDDPGKVKSYEKKDRSAHSATVGRQIDEWKSEHADSVKAFLRRKELDL